MSQVPADPPSPEASLRDVLTTVEHALATAAADTADTGDSADSADVVSTVRALLEVHLAGLDPDHTALDPDLADVAGWWVRLRDPDRADAAPAVKQWAAYNYRTALDQHGATHRHTWQAGRRLADVLAERGEHDDAADIYGQVMTGMTHAGATDDACLIAADLYAAAHAAGHCRTAIANLTAIWKAWRTECGDEDPTGLPIIIRLVALNAACGNRIAAKLRWSQAQAALPPPGNPERLAAVRHAVQLINTTTQLHTIVCQRQRHPSSI